MEMADKKGKKPAEEITSSPIVEEPDEGTDLVAASEKPRKEPKVVYVDVETLSDCVGKLKPGDHISRPLDAPVFNAVVSLMTAHHGIVVEVSEDDAQVMNFVNPNGGGSTVDPNARIVRSNMKEFMKGKQNLRVFTYAEGVALPVEETISRALSMEDTDYGQYNFLTNNCESFSMWAKTGNRTSMQVQRGVTAAKVAVNGIRSLFTVNPATKLALADSVRRDLSFMFSSIPKTTVYRIKIAPERIKRKKKVDGGEDGGEGGSRKESSAKPESSSKGKKRSGSKAKSG